MTKTELLAAIETAGWVIITDTEQNVEGALTNWVVLGVQGSGDVLKIKKFFYAVINSVAYWREQDQLVSPSTFREDVMTYINDLITADTIEGAILNNIDETQEIALVDFYATSGGKVNLTHNFINYGSGEVLQWREIG